MNAVEIAQRAIAAIDVEARVRGLLGGHAEALVAIGKAAPAMAHGAVSTMTFARSCIVTSVGTDARGLTVMRGAHPSPDETSVAAGNAALSTARGARSVVALISGGASALACAPRVDLATKRAVSDAMLDAGAPVVDVNLVRRHLSHLKGGGLARVAAGPVRTLIVSDVLVARDSEVVLGDPWDVGSGPATPDPTTVEQARAALARWAPDLVDRVSDALATTFPADAPDAARVTTTFVATPFDLADAAAELARRAGFSVEILPASLGAVDALADEYASRAARLGRRSVLVRVAEPSVVLSARRGRGGRCGRLALLAWSRGLPGDVELACVASDGSDGSSGNAGACVRGRAPSGASDALDAFDDAPFLEAHGAAIAGAPSGTNLLDVHVLLRH